MKSCVFHKKYLLAGIYIIFVLFTCCNSRFYHTPLAKICSVTEKQTLSREGTRGSKEYYYTQKITARILNGSHKGEKITVSNEYTSSQIQTKKYHKGDTVLLSGSKESPGKTIRSVKRDGYLALLAGGLFFLLICITGKQGFYTIISLILNTVIFAYGFQAFTEGKNILNICNVIAVLFSLTTLICLNGIHRKTFSSGLSTRCVLFLIMALFEFSIYMYGDLDYSNLEYLGSTGNSADIFWADIMLTGLGAIMDVTVTISAADDRHILFEFHCKDTGVGMSKEFQNHIFEPFTQETGGARSVYGGTGLGMPITKKLIEKMGGTIKFESEKNVGTTFMVQLPFLISADMKQAESQEDDVSIEGMRILLAEDNELNMEIAEFLLSNAGAEIIRASNGKEAVEAFAKSGVGEINVILMDIMMPVMDGLEATREIRTMNRSDASAVVIIAMTANAFTEDKTKALKSGMDDYLTKPLESEKLIRALSRYKHN